MASDTQYHWTTKTGLQFSEFYKVYIVLSLPLIINNRKQANRKQANQSVLLANRCAF